MDNTTLGLIFCFGLPVVLLAGLLAAVIRKRRRKQKGIEKIAEADDYVFIEDAEGRICRKRKSFRNVLAIVIFSSMAIGMSIFVVSSATRRDWGNLLLGLGILTIPVYVLWYLWKLCKAGKLVFDMPTKTIITQFEGFKERVPFKLVERFTTRFRPMENQEGEDVSNYGHYDVFADTQTKGSIPIATFSGKKKPASRKVEDFVARLEGLVQQPEKR